MEQALLATARGMFISEGFDGVSMEGIAAATDITRTTLYSRYATKEVLFRAVVEDTIAGWYASAQAQEAHELADIRHILHYRVRTMAALLVDPVFGAFHLLILSNRHRFPELAPMMHELGYQASVRLLAADIRSAADRDGLLVSRPEVVAEHILSATYGWFMQYALVRDLTAGEIEAHGCRVVDQLMLVRDRW